MNRLMNSNAKTRTTRNESLAFQLASGSIISFPTTVSKLFRAKSIAAVNLSRSLMICLLIFIFGVHSMNGATRTASVTGNWNATATWGGAAIPIAGDDVIISNNVNVTVTAAASCATITFPTNNANNTTITINTGITLTVSGVINIPRSTNNANTLAVGAGILNAGSITFTNGGGGQRHFITISTGTIKVTGDVSETGSTGSATITFTGSGLLQLGGAFLATGTGTINTVAGSTIEYNGTSQTVQTWGYANLTISGSGTKTLAASTTVAGILNVHTGSTLALTTYNLSTPSSLMMDDGAASGASITGTTGLLTLGGDATINNIATGTIGATISCPLALAANRTFTVADDGTSATDLNISGIISGAYGLTKAGNGTLVLSGANTYTSATTIYAGTVKLGVSSTVSTAGPLGTSAGGTTVNSGAVLDANGFSLTGAYTEALTLNGTGLSALPSGALTNTSPIASTIICPITLGSASTITATGTTGTLTCSGSVGTGAFALTLDGATGSSGTMSGIISAPTSVTKNGAGTWTLSGANTYAGATTINAGTLKLGSTGALGTVAGITTVVSGGVLDLNGITLSTAKQLTLNGAGLTALPAGALTNTGGNASYSGAITLASASSINTNGNITLGGGITGSQNLTKIGAGVLNLGSNTANLGGLTITTGTIISTSGTLNLTGDFTNNGTFTHNSGTVNFSGTLLQTIGGTPTVPPTIFNNFILNNNAGITLASTATVANLTLTNGIINTTATNLLTVTSTASTAVSGSFSSTCYVNGPLKWSLGNSGNYIFPVGDATNYRPFELDNITGVSPVVIVTMNSTGASGADGTSVSAVGTRYWNAQLTGGSLTNSTVKLVEGGLIPTNVIAGSTTLTGPYSSLGGNNIGSSITSDPGIPITANSYFVIGTKITLLVALSDDGTQTPASSVAGGTNNVLLHQSTLKITALDATLTGMTCSTGGTYIPSDISNLKVYYSSNNTFSVGGSTLLAILTNPGSGGTKTFTSFTPQVITNGATGYIFITADIANSATVGNTINLNPLTTGSFTFSTAATKSGSTTTGGVQTITNATYYNTVSGASALQNLSSWRTNPDGTGSQPTSFAGNYQIFNIINGPATIGSDWAVSGTNSKVVLGSPSNSAIVFTIPSTSAFIGTIDIPAASSGSNTLIIQNTTIPTFGNLGSGSTVDYNGTTQTVAGVNYFNLIISATGTKTAGGAITATSLDNGGSSNAASILDMTGYNLIASSIENTGATIKFSGVANGLAISTGTVEYSAPTGNQTVVAGTYNSLILDNSSNTNTANGTITANTLMTSDGGTLNMGTYALAVTAPTNNGIIRTQNTSVTPIPTGLTWGGSVTYDATTGGQTIVTGTYSTLIMGNTGGVQSAAGDITVNGTLSTTIGGILNMGSNLLSGTATLANSGTIETQNTSSLPIPTGTWGGTIQYNATTGAQTVATGTYNNLTINNISGLSLGGATIVAGTLTLSGGIVNTNSNLLNITNPLSNAVMGYSATAYVNGSLQRSMASGNSYFFPVGNASIYGPFEMNNIIGSSPVVTVTLSETGANTTDGTLTAINSQNWFAQLMSGSISNATVRLTENGLTTTSVVASSANQGGNYTNQGGNNFIGNAITSNTGIPFTGSTYFAAGTGITSVVVLSDNGTQVASASIAGGTANLVLHTSKLNVTQIGATLTGITCSTAGTYIPTDITNLKVYYSTSPTFDGGATLLCTQTSPGAAGSQTFPSFASPLISTLNPGYIYVTADIAPGATYGHTINLNALLPTNFTFTNASITGLTVDGGLQTFGGSTYYNKTGGSNALQTLSNWSTNADGTGTSPTSFTADNQTFYLSNGTSATIGGAWTVSGSSSKVVLGNTANPAITFTVPNNFAFTGKIDITSAFSGSNTLVLQNTTIPTLGTLDSGSTVDYDGTSQIVTPINYYHLTLSGSGTKTLKPTTNILGNLTFAGTASATAVEGLTVGGDVILGSGSTFNGGTYTHTVSGNWTNNGGTFNPGTGTGTVIMNGTGMNINGSGASTTFNNLSLGGTANVSMNIATNINGSLTIPDGTIFNAGANSLTVNGITFIGNGTSGALNITSATGTKTFTGIVTVNPGGSLIETAACPLAFGSDVTIGGTYTEFGGAGVGFAGNISNNGTYTASTGTHTFTGTGKTIGGANAISIHVATFTGTYTNSGTLSASTLTVTGTTLTNNGTLTASTALSGTGGLTQGTTGILNLGGLTDITTLTASAAGNTVDYTGTGQTVKATTYDKLILTGQTLTIGAITATDLTLSGTATATAGAIFNITGNLNIGNGTTLNGGISFNHTIGGNWINNGTFNANLSTITLNGITQSITGSTTFNNLTLGGSGTKTFATATATTGTFSINTGVIASLGDGLTHTALSLNLGGNGQAIGLWGGSNSTATFKSPTYFDGSTGMINVASSTCLAGSWTGYTSSDWNTVTNWCDGHVPNNTTNVSIPASAVNQPVISAPAICGSMSINTGASLTVNGTNTLTVSGGWTNFGTFTQGTGTVIFNGTGNSSINSTATSQTFNNLEVNQSAGQTLSVGGSTTTLNVLGTFTQTQGNFTAPATMNVGSDFTLTASTFISGTNLTVSGSWINNGGTFTANGGTVTLNGSSNMLGGTSATTFNNLNLSGTAFITTGMNTTIGGALTIPTGTTFAPVTTSTLTVTGATTISGTYTDGSSGAKSFTGDITLNSGSVWNETAVSNYSMGGNFINNAATFMANTGVHTFTGTSKAISGSTTAIRNVTITGAITNSINLTVNTALSGTGSLTNTGTLNLGGIVDITTLSAAAVGNIVNYTGTGQVLKVTSYNNLTLSGGAETFGTIATVTGDLTLSGAATATTGAALTIGGKLNIGDGTTLTTGGFAMTVTGTTTVGGGTSGTLAITSATGTKTFTGAVTINTGGSITETAPAQLAFLSDVTNNGAISENGNAMVGFEGNLVNNGTFNGSTGIHTFSGTGKTISGTGLINIPSATFTGSYTNSGSLSISTLLTNTGVTLTNNGTITATAALSGTGGLIQGPNGMLNLGGTSGITTLTATAVGNTVNYTGTSQTLRTPYSNLSFSGGAETAPAGLTVTGTFSIATGATFNAGTFTHNIGGNLINNGTLNPGTGTGTINLNGSNQTISGSTVTTFNNLTLAGSGTKTFVNTTNTGGIFLVNNGVFANLGTGLTQTANSLTLGGNGQSSGLWGSSSSTAFFKNDTYFSPSSGLLNVANFSCVAGTWTGYTSTDWNTTTNWCDGVVPTSSTNVTINSGGNQPIIGSAALCNNITLGSGAFLTITGANTLTIGGNFTNSGTFTANTSTVIYSANAAQTVGNGSYYNLTLAVSGAKTTSTNVIVNGVLSMQGSATLTVAPTYGPAATLQYNTATSRTAGSEWISPFIATGGITMAGSGIITMNSAKVLSTSVPLTINTGGKLATNNLQLNLGGDFVNTGGTFTAGSSNIVIDNTALTQNIAGFTTTGGITMQKNGGTAIFTGTVTGGVLTVNGTGGTLNLGSSTGHTLTSVALNAGTLTMGATLSNPLVINFGGGTLSTGASTGFTETAGVLNVTANSTIALGSGSHSLTFAPSSLTNWNNGVFLLITGWSGNWNGTSGTAGRVFVGTDNTGLTTNQLAQVFFSNGTNYYNAILLSTGEVVPGNILTPTLSYAIPNTLILNSTITPVYPTINYPYTGYTVSPGLPTGLTFNNSTGLISGTPTGSASGPTAYTVTATSAIGNATTTFNITTRASNIYYSRATGNWNANTTWSLSSNGPAIPTGYPLDGDVVNIERGYNVTAIANAACTNINFSSETTGTLGGTLTVNSGFTMAVSGTVTLYNYATANVSATIAGGGTLNCSSVNIGNGAVPNTRNVDYTHTLTSTIASFTIANNLTINSYVGSSSSRLGDGVFTQTSGIVTVNGSIVTVNADINNNTSTFTLGNTSPTLILSAATPFNLGSGINAITLSGTGSTVIYNGTVQTVGAYSYTNLTLAGSGVKTTTGITVNGILSMEGTATASTVPTYGGAATLQYNTSIGRTAGPEWMSPFAATGGIIIANTGLITMNSTEVMGTSVPFTINALANFATAGNSLTFGGNFVNNGTFSAGISPIVITGNATTQTISGFTTTGLVSMTKTGGTATLQGNVNGNGLTINGSGGILNLGTGFTHTFTGTWTRTAGTLNGGTNCLLRIGGSVSGTGGTFTSGTTGTVEWYAIGNQTLAGVSFNNLTLSGSGVKTTTNVTVNGVLSMEGSATASVAPTYATNAILQYNTATARNAGVEWVSPFPLTGSTATGGIIIANTGQITMNSSEVINSNLTINKDASFSTGNSSLTLGENFINNGGTFTAGTSPLFINGTLDQSIAGISTTGNITVNKTGGTTATLTGPLSANVLTITNGLLNLGSILTHTANTLTLGLFGQPAGYYGGAGSNALFTNPTYFGPATGLLYISASSCAPGFWLGYTSTDWNTPSNWCDGNVPTFATNVTINIGTYQPVIDASASCKDITFSTGASLRVSPTGTFTVSGNWANNGSFTADSLSTVIYNGTGQSVGAGTYYNLVMSGSGTKTLNGATITRGDLTVNTGVTLSILNSLLTLNGNLFNAGTVGGPTPTGGVTIAGKWPLQSIGAFTTTGTVSMTKTAGVATFTGNVGGAGLTINGNGGTLNLSAGTHTFTQVITLTTGTLNGGTSTLTENATGTAWNGNGSVFTAGTGTVIFGGAAQTLAASTTTFNNLTFNGTGTKTVSSPTVVNGDMTVIAGVTVNTTTNLLTLNGNLTNAGALASTTGGVTISGTGTQSIDGFTVTTGTITMSKTGGVATFNKNMTGAALTIIGTNGGTLNLGTGTHTFSGIITLTSGSLNGGSSVLNASNATPWNGTGSVFTGGTGTVNFNGGTQALNATTTTFNNLNFSGTNTKTVNSATITNGALTVNTGITLSMTSNLLTLNGNLINTGTVNSTSGGVTINGTGTQSIGAFTTTGTVSMTKSSGVATFTAAIRGANLTINGTGGTLSLGAGFTHIFTGNWTNTTGTLDGGSSLLQIAGNAIGTGGSFTPSTGTVEWNAAGAQTIAGVNYNNLILSGSGLKTWQPGTNSITTNLSLNGTASTTATSNLIIGGNVLLSTGTSFNGGAFTHTIAGNWTNNGTFTNGGGTIALTGLAKTIGGTSSTTFNNLTLGNGTSQSGFTFLINETVNGALALQNNTLVTLGAFNLTLGSAATCTGTYSTTCMIITNGLGQLIRNMSTTSATGSFTFPVGDATNIYSPITLNFTTGTYAPTGASVSVKVTKAKQPNNISGANYLNRYWSVSQTGITSFTADVTGTYVHSDIVGLESNQVSGIYVGAFPWLRYDPLAANTLSTIGVTAFGDFTGIDIMPSMTTSTNTLTGFSYPVGYGPSTQNLFFTVGGDLLTTNIKVLPTESFDISLTPGALFAPQGLITLPVYNRTVATDTIYVRMKAGFGVGPVGPSDIICSTDNMPNATVTCSGVVSNLPLITVNPGTLTGFNYNVGGTTPGQPFTVSGTYLTANVVVTPPTDYSISTTLNGTYQTLPMTLIQTSGNLALTTIYVKLNPNLSMGVFNETVKLTSDKAVMQFVQCNGSVTLPTINLSTYMLGGFIYNSGPTTSGVQSFTVNGINLTGNIILTAPATVPASYEICLTPNGTYSSSITLTPPNGGSTIPITTIYIRLKTSLPVANYGTITSPLILTATSTGAIQQNLGLIGQVYSGTSPNLFSSVTTLNGFAYVGIGPSVVQSFTISGTALNADISVTAPANYEIASSFGGTYSSTVSIPKTGTSVNSMPIYVRLISGLKVNTYNGGTIVMTSAGAVSQNITIGNSNVFAVPTITAGPSDASLLCNGSTVTLSSVGTGYNIQNQYWTGPNGFYSVDSIHSLGIITPINEGIYTVTGTRLSGDNLLANPGFELGNTGFGTSYKYVVPGYSIDYRGDLYAEGNYTVDNLPINSHPGFGSCVDHTTGAGKQMIINGAKSNGIIAWSESVNVAPGTDYQFNYWVQTVSVAGYPAQLQFYMNGVQVGPVDTATLAQCQWKHFIYNVNSGPNTTVQLAIINWNAIAGGNDFALDDMVFEQAFPVTSSVDVEINAPITSVYVGITASSDPKPLYSGQSVTFIAHPINGGPTPTYQWIVNHKNVINSNGPNSAFFQYKPNGNDSIRCFMTSSYPCPGNMQASSNTLNVIYRANFWLGSNSTDWGTDSNWSANYVPEAGSDVEFATSNNNGQPAVNDLVLDQNRTIGYLINATSHQIFIPAGKGLIVNNTITTDNDVNRIYIQSTNGTDGLANGSLTFHNPPDLPVNGTVEMYSKAYWDKSQAVNNQYKWQFFGIPLQSVVANPTFYGSYVRRLDETGSLSNHWIQLGNDSILKSFVGYELVHQSPQTIIFQGKLENGDLQPVPLSYTSGAGYPGQHLFANPYTAAINIKQLNFGAQMDSTVYLYNMGSFIDWTNNSGGSKPGNSPGQYTSVPQNEAGNNQIPGQVPSMQGMLVKALNSSSDATFGISYNTVVVNNTDLQRVGASKDITLSTKVCTMIDVTGSRYSDRMWIFSEPTCSHRFDNGWDGTKMLGSALTPQLYALEADGNYQIDAVDDINGTDLGFQAGVDTSYTLTFTQSNTKSMYLGLYLIDRVANTVTDITASGSTYSFTAQSTPETVNRFTIVTRPTDQNSSDADSGLRIFSSKGSILVQNFSSLSGEVMIYDLAGHYLQYATVAPLGGITMLSGFIPGVFIAKAATANEKITKKIIIK